MNDFATKNTETYGHNGYNGHKGHKGEPSATVSICLEGLSNSSESRSRTGQLKMYDPIPAETEIVASQIIGAGIEVHRTLGPGFLETIYQQALCLELNIHGIKFERERAIAVHYRGHRFPGNG